MSAPPARRTPPAELAPTPVDAGRLGTVGVAYYRPGEFAVHLRALARASGRKMVVVLGVREDEARELAAADGVAARLVLTTDAPDFDPAVAPGWFEPDPQRAVVVAATGLRARDVLVLLFPADWAGPAPDDLIDRARRWRASPHSPEDDTHFAAGN